MKKKPISTQFAPAERAGDKIIQQQSDMIAEQSLLIKTLDAVSTAVIILNQERQVVFGNRAFLDLLEKDHLPDITGMRLGEVIGCTHAKRSESGCGTTEFCSMCGAVSAMLSSLSGKKDVQECRITLEEDPHALDLRVMSAPVSVKGEDFAVFSVEDIANEKRKEVLEKIFIHDLLNTAGGLQGISKLLPTANEESLTQYTSIIQRLADKLVDEIETQKQLIQAENSSLAIDITETDTATLLSKVRELYANHDVAIDRIIEVDPGAGDFKISTDETLMMRVIGNMTKNALEATKTGETVILDCSKESDKIRFSVRNPGEIPRETRLQIFQRSFSTKGTGRGLGTYSIKLLSEHYLKGTVGFSSSLVEGTVFYGDYPINLTRG